MKHKKLLIAAVVVVLLLVASACGGNRSGEKTVPASSPAPTASEPAKPASSENPLMVADLKTGDILNGFQTEKIGEFGYIEISKAEMQSVTGDQLTEFCKNRVDGSGFNWVAIVFEDGTSLRVVPSSWQVSIPYGSVDIDTATFSDSLGSVQAKEWSQDGSAPVSYKFISFEELQEIQAAVEAVVPDEHKGDGYFCDILTASDGTGYIVSLQIDVDTSECSDVIASLEDAINGLGDTRISSVEIIAVKDMQIVGTNTGA